MPDRRHLRVPGLVFVYVRSPICGSVEKPRCRVIQIQELDRRGMNMKYIRITAD